MCMRWRLRVCALVRGFVREVTLCCEELVVQLGTGAGFGMEVDGHIFVRLASGTWRAANINLFFRARAQLYSLPQNSTTLGFL